MRSLSPEIDLKPTSTNVRTTSKVTAGTVRPRSFLAEGVKEILKQGLPQATVLENSMDCIASLDVRLSTTSKTSDETSTSIPTDATLNLPARVEVSTTAGHPDNAEKGNNCAHILPVGVNGLNTNDTAVFDIIPAVKFPALPNETKKIEQDMVIKDAALKKTFKRSRQVLGFQKSELKDSSKRLKADSDGKENKLCNENRVNNQASKTLKEKVIRGPREDLENLMYLAEQTLSKAAMGWFDVPSEDSISRDDSDVSSRTSSEMQEMSQDLKKAQFSTGRWTSEEHSRFLTGLGKYGKDWRNIAKCIRTRSYVQTRTHAQKYFKKVAKSRFNTGREIPNELMSTANDGKKWSYDKDEGIDMSHFNNRLEGKIDKVSKDSHEGRAQVKAFEAPKVSEVFSEGNFTSGFQLAGLHYLGALANPNFLAAAAALQQQQQNQSSQNALQQLLQQQLHPFQCLPYVQYPVAKQQ